MREAKRMKKMQSTYATRLAITAALVALPAAARAADPTPASSAQALFDRAMELMDEGNDARACPMLEQSLRLDPAMGTRYRLAECYEKTGRLSAAYTLYSEVTEEARLAGMTDRETRARARSEALFPMLARLVVWVPADVAQTPDLRVTLDGTPLDPTTWVGEPRIVELGEHILEATAPGHKTYRRIIPIRVPGEPVEVSVPSLHDVNEPPLAPRALKAGDLATPSAGRSAALVLGLGGTGALAAGIGIAGMAAATGGLSDTTRISAGAGIGLGGLGVVAAGLTWLVTGSPPSSTQKSGAASTGATVTLVPRVGWNDGGISIVGKF